MSRLPIVSAVVFAAMTIVGAAQADVIISPISATASSSDPTTPIVNTINQSGLTSNFISGFTDFDTYIAGNPLHDFKFGTEWFSAEDIVNETTSATLTYDLGSVVTINRLALWNEEFAGIANFNVLISTDNLAYTTVLSGAAPLDNPLDTFYPAQVFNLGKQIARYVKIDAYNCPQPNPDGFVACAMGEIAFAMSTVGGGPGTGVPAPGALLMLGGGLLGLAGLRKCSRKTV